MEAMLRIAALSGVLLQAQRVSSTAAPKFEVVSIRTTEPYLGCKQKLRYAFNDKMGIEP
jgi:hypothetical protein